jgi:hypothetical protein
MTGGGILLPLSPQNGYKPEVLICGGSDLDDTLETRLIKASDPATTQCVRMVLTKSGIKKGWKVEHMPEGRIMPDMITMPDGKVLIVNGAKSVSFENSIISYISQYQLCISVPHKYVRLNFVSYVKQHLSGRV